MQQREALRLWDKRDKVNTMTNEQFDELIAAVRLISEGGSRRGPAGLEGLAMAISGDPLEDNLVSAVRDHALAVREIAEAIRSLTPKG